MKSQDFDVKLAALVLLLTEDAEVSRTSLNKLLFFTEVAYYIKSDTLFSDSIYIKMQYGPVPDSISIVRGVLIRSNWIQEQEQKDLMLYSFYYKNIAESSLMLRIKEQLRTKDAQVLQIVDIIKQKLRPRTAGELSRISHMYEPWKSASWNGELDFTRIKKDNGFMKWLKDELKIVPN